MYPNINLKAIGIVLAVLLTFSSGWYVEHLKFVAYKTQVIALGKVQEQKNKDIAKQQILVNEGIKHDYQTKLNSINAMYNSLRSSSRSMPTSGNSSIIINGIAYDTISIAQECALETQKLVSLQEWVRTQVK